MKQKLAGLLLLFGAVAIFSSSLPGCKSKPKDADIKTAVEAAITANPDLKGLMVDVKEGVATITGEVKDAAAQSAVQTLIAAVKGVKSVQNNVSVAPPPPPPVEITADDPLTAAVRDATKDFPSVTATVKDGVISVTGELKSDAWKKLKMALDGLKPKKVDASGLKIAK
jgi:hyperosmotically inducible periplasmic protein